MPKNQRVRGGDWNDTGPIKVCCECEREFRTEIEPQLSSYRIFCTTCDAAFTRSERRYAAELDDVAHARSWRPLVTPAQRVARCDHKFIDSVQCVKCGWIPPAEQNT